MLWTIPGTFPRPVSEETRNDSEAEEPPSSMAGHEVCVCVCGDEVMWARTWRLSSVSELDSRVRGEQRKPINVLYGMKSIYIAQTLTSSTLSAAQDPKCTHSLTHIFCTARSVARTRYNCCGLFQVHSPALPVKKPTIIWRQKSHHHRWQVTRCVWW